MSDREHPAAARYRLESQELRRDRRRLTTRRELVDRALAACADPDRRQELRAERRRITEMLAATRTRLEACWDRSRVTARPAD